MIKFLAEGDLEKVEAYRLSKEEFGNLDQTHARLILGDERFDRCSAFLTYSSSNNKYYTIAAKGESGIIEGQENDEAQKVDKPAMAVSALVQIVGSQVRYLSWQEGWS